MLDSVKVRAAGLALHLLLFRKGKHKYICYLQHNMFFLKIEINTHTLINADNCAWCKHDSWDWEVAKAVISENV